MKLSVAHKFPYENGAQRNPRRAHRWGQAEVFRALCLRLRDEQDASNST